MSKQDRQEVSILVILLVVLGLTGVLGYRMNQPPTVQTAAVQAPESKPSSNPPAATAAKIRLDLVEKTEAGEEQIGKKNVFQYQQAPAPPPSVSRPGPIAQGPPTVPGNTPPATTPVQRPPTQPPPPPIPLKYQGFAAVRSPGQGLTAFVSDDSRHYNVTVGEVLMGRYRIVSISDKSIEIEDLEYNRRQTLPFLK